MTLSQKRFSASVKIKTKNYVVIYSALRPDIENSAEGRATSKLRVLGDSLLLEIASEDLSHLRASLNSYLRLAEAATSCLDVSV